MEVKHLHTTFLRGLDEESREALRHYYLCLLNDCGEVGVHERSQLVLIQRGGPISVPERFWTHKCVRCESRGSVVPQYGRKTMSVPISWKCRGCGGYVCFNCTLTVPGSVPLRFRDATLCSEECWRAIGSPEEEPEESLEDSTAAGCRLQGPESEDEGSRLAARGSRQKAEED